jgi:hypothetical protein
MLARNLLGVYLILIFTEQRKIASVSLAVNKYCLAPHEPNKKVCGGLFPHTL